MLLVPQNELLRFCLLAYFVSLQLTHAYKIGKCEIFPSNNIWNVDISSLPVHPQSTSWVNLIGADSHLKADFGADLWKAHQLASHILLFTETQ